jgi:hypothetical protein
MNSIIRAIAALAGGVLAWKAVAELATLLGRLVWPAYAAVETQRVFTLDMYLSRLTVGALATIIFGAVVGWIARGERRTINLIIAAWLIYSVIDHYIVWDEFPVWYHILYLAYITPLALLGAKLVERGSRAAVAG